ncbi:MAG: multiheme c-type cytochrome [Polyangiaceae bacterium]
MVTRLGACIAFGLTLVAVACDPAVPTSIPTAPASPSSTALPPRARPGPSPQLRPDGYDPVAENAACGRCHPVIAAEWEGSLHQRAWDDELFLAAYAVEPIAFCRGCHAPEVEAGDERSTPSRHLGVGCVTCHVLGAEILGVTARGPAPEAHAVVATPAIGGDAWCGGCHQFDFPEPQAAPMQGTLGEHAASPHRAETCQHCHMPVVDGPRGPHRDHRFAVQADPERLRAAVVASARQRDERNLVVTLRAEGVGHAMPTGDIFRRLEVRAFAAEDNTARPVVLARRFQPAPAPHGGMQRLQVGDDRLPASGAPVEVELFFLRPPVPPIRWEVAYQRMGPSEAAVFGVDLSADETIVASGSIEPER